MKATKVRIDKWLWAARFFKTRSMATKAVNGGRVHVNGARVKPARNVEIGDQLRISRDQVEFTVIVQDLAHRRGPASVARTLYEETADSITAREDAQDQRRLLRQQQKNSTPDQRPGKRDRRLIRRFIRKQET